MRTEKMYILLLVAIFLAITGCNSKTPKEEGPKPLPGFQYDSVKKRFVNPRNGFWYIEDSKGHKILPSDEYATPNEIKIEGIKVEPRPNEVWQLFGYRLIVGEKGVNWGELSFENPPRMNASWYKEQVRQINNLQDINVDITNRIIKIPLYYDKGNTQGYYTTTNYYLYKNLTKEQLISLVEFINPSTLKPTLTPKQRFELRAKIFNTVKDKSLKYFIEDQIGNCTGQLAMTLIDDRYVELFNKQSPRWLAYEYNQYFGVAGILKEVNRVVKHPLLKKDLETVIGLCEYGLQKRDVRAIIDANRILQDLTRHLFKVPYQGPGEAQVGYGDFHKKYFKASRTLEGYNTLISDYQPQP